MQNLPQAPSIERPKEVLDVELQHPAASHRHQPLPQGLQRLVCRSARTEAVRAVTEVLLVDRVQYHRHRALQHLVLEGRNPDRPGLATIAFGDVDAPYGRRTVRPGLRPAQEVTQILFEMLRILLGRLSVDACSAVLARPPIGFEKKVEVDVVGQRPKRRVRHLPRQLRYSLKFR